MFEVDMIEYWLLVLTKHETIGVLDFKSNMVHFFLFILHISGNRSSYIYYLSVYLNTQELTHLTNFF